MVRRIRWPVVVLIAFSLVIATHCDSDGAVPCVLRDFADGSVCVCNETYCDRTSKLIRGVDEILIVSSSKAGLRFNEQKQTLKRQFNNDQHYVADVQVEDRSEYQTNDSKKANNIPTLLGLFWGGSSDTPIKATVTVNRGLTYQKITGFGGAFTGSVSHLLQQIPTLEKAIYESYYSNDAGIGFNMMRIPIGGCDFDLAPWAYNESPTNDASLSNFTALDQRDVERINQIKKIPNWSNIKFVGAAWSPPPWMKTNNAWSGFSSLLPQFYETWAQYHLRYLQLMNEKDIRFWAISTGNEPLNGIIGFVFVHFMSLGWTAGNQALWVGDHLGPLLRKSEFKDVKLLGSDDQRYVFPWWFDQMKSAHPESINYLDGFAVHWYWDKLAPPSLLDATHEKYPDKLILNTESCLGDKPWQTHGPVLGSWDRAEDYITSYFQDLQHSVNGWIDWNLILDENGGPNYTNNTVDAPIIVNITSKEFYKQPMFYAIGHFSRFISADSQRIDVTSSNDQVLAIGFKLTSNEVALVLYNKSAKPAEISVADLQRTIQVNVPAKSIHSVVYAPL